MFVRLIFAENVCFETTDPGSTPGPSSSIAAPCRRAGLRPGRCRAGGPGGPDKWAIGPAGAGRWAAGDSKRLKSVAQRARGWGSALQAAQKKRLRPRGAAEALRAAFYTSGVKRLCKKRVRSAALQGRIEILNTSSAAKTFPDEFSRKIWKILEVLTLISFKCWKRYSLNWMGCW